MMFEIVFPLGLAAVAAVAFMAGVLAERAARVRRRKRQYEELMNEFESAYGLPSEVLY